MNNYTAVKTAIINKQPISATYDGYYRELCPHAIGTKNGKNQGLFYQFGGDTSKGPIGDEGPNNWKCMHIDKLQNIQVIGGEWHTASNHSNRSTCIDAIDVEVDY